MSRPVQLIAVFVLLAAPAALLAACGTQKITVAKNAPTHAGAVLFQQRCAGCHTLEQAGTHGSASNVRTRERTDGPNFNTRCENYNRVLYAIENGGFSGAIMPANIVLGKDAQEVARFVAKYGGSQAPSTPGLRHCQAPQSTNTTQGQTNQVPQQTAPGVGKTPGVNSGA